MPAGCRAVAAEARSWNWGDRISCSQKLKAKAWPEKNHAVSLRSTAATEEIRVVAPLRRSYRLFQH
jgi:hypothetical protein